MFWTLCQSTLYLSLWLIFQLYCLGCEQSEVTAEQDDVVLDTLKVYALPSSGVKLSIVLSNCEENEITAEQDNYVLDYASLVSVEAQLSIVLSTLGCEKSEVTAEQDDDVLDTWFSSGIYPFAGR